MVRGKTLEEKLMDYLSDFNINDPAIQLKYKHSIRVSNRCEEIARSLGLQEREIYLAKVLGLFHDIGRFYQWSEYTTFSDKDSIPHAQYGAGLLRVFDIFESFGIELTPEETDIILVAITHHSDVEIPKVLGDTERFWCNIIRDADKADIVYVFGEDIGIDELLKPHLNILHRKTLENSGFSEGVLNHFYNREPILAKDRGQIGDSIILYYSFAYQLNFDRTRQMMLEDKGYERLHKGIRFKNKSTQAQYNEIYRETMNILQSQAKAVSA